MLYVNNARIEVPELYLFFFGGGGGGGGGGGVLDHWLGSTSEFMCMICHLFSFLQSLV
jgi:hypothetical protein